MGKNDNVEVNELINKLEVLNKMYELVRFVDPIKKKVLSIDKEECKETDSYCYDIWTKNKICDNCISARAYNENKTYVKIEYNPQSICMVTAVPIEFKDKRIVIEFMKDATNTFICRGIEHENEVDVYSLIDKLNAVVYKDGLTQIYNRRFINERLPIDIINTMMKDGNLSIIMADLDHFKNTNDTYGHIAGDEVLRKFGEILRNSIRMSEDWAARFGGEEFLICLPDTPLEAAAEIAERIRKEMEDQRFGFCTDNIKITSSFGVCSLNEIGDNNFETLIQCADKKLYKAKHNGRNRVEK